MVKYNIPRHNFVISKFHENGRINMILNDLFYNRSNPCAEIPFSNIRPTRSENPVERTINKVFLNSFY